MVILDVEKTTLPLRRDVNGWKQHDCYTSGQLLSIATGQVLWKTAVNERKFACGVS